MVYGYYDNGVHHCLGTKSKKKHYRDFDDLYAEIEKRLLRKYLTPDAKKVSTEGLEEVPTSVDQQRRINATRLLLGLAPMPQVLIDRINALSAEEQEDLDTYNGLLDEIEMRLNRNETLANIYELFLNRGDLQKRNGEHLSFSGFHRWGRKVRKKVLKEQGGAMSRMPRETLDAIRELVMQKYTTATIYKMLVNRGLLKRLNGGPDFSLIAVQDRIRQARRELRMGHVKGATIVEMHKQGKTAQEIVVELQIPYHKYYQHAVKQGIIVPKKRTA